MKYSRKWQKGLIKEVGRLRREIYGEKVTDNAISKRLREESHVDTFRLAIEINERLLREKQEKKEEFRKLKASIN